MPGDPASLGFNTVRAFAESRTGAYWVATDGGGLNEFDASTGKFAHYTTHTSNLNSDAVLDVVQDHEGITWLGSWEGGVSRFDRATKSFTAYTSKNAGLGDDNVFALHVDGSGGLWAGTQKHGVYRFDRARQRFVSVVAAEQLVGQLPRTETSVAVRVIGGSPDGRHLLIGTEGSGLADYDIASGTLTLHQSLATDSSSLSGNTVRAAIEGDNGVVWIGTTTGLDRFDRASKKLTHFGEADGLPSGYIAGLAQDAVRHAVDQHRPRPRALRRRRQAREALHHRGRAAGERVQRARVLRARTTARCSSVGTTASTSCDRPRSGGTIASRRSCSPDSSCSTAKCRSARRARRSRSTSRGATAWCSRTSSR